MFERFTDRARRALAFANQEAQRFNHNYIGTEHILLGLLKESGGVADKVLREFGVDLPKARSEVVRLVGVGLDVVSVGTLPQTLKAKEVVQEAIGVALKMGHNYVGTEHLLLALMDVESMGRKVLVGLGVEAERVRDMVYQMTAIADLPASAEPERRAVPKDDVWTGACVPVALGEAMVLRIREVAKRKTSETGKATSEADVIRSILEEHFREV